MAVAQKCPCVTEYTTMKREDLIWFVREMNIVLDKITVY
jgi:hypothetical protein